MRKIAQTAIGRARRGGLRLAISAVLWTVVVLVLAAGCPEYLRRIESLSLMVTAPMFMDDYWRTPGGPLELAARWLTETFYHPWLGAAVYALLLAAVQWLGCKAFKIRRWWQLAFAVVPLWLLWAMLGMGYLIFNTKTPAFAMQSALGACLVLACACWVPRRHWVWSAAAYVVLALVGYYLAGIYGLVAVACCMVANWRQWQSVLAGACAIALAPWAVCAITTGQLHYGERYSAALPRVAASQADVWLPKTPVALTDENFRLTLSLRRALEEGRWDDAAEMAARQQGEPTRLNVMLGSFALMRMGQAADRMFAMPIGSADYNTPLPDFAVHEAGAIPVWYNVGKVNLAYRWAMEYAVERGLSVECLKYLAKCALLNGDYHLADKYLDILSLTRHHHDWAARYRQYVSDPSKMSQDPELAALLRLQVLDNMLSTDDGSLEGAMWPLLEIQQPHTPEQLELSMIADLVMRNLDNFMLKVPGYVEATGRLPLHFQEAVLMWCARNASQVYDQLPIDLNLKRRFGSAVSALNRLKGADEATRVSVMAPYAGTYWYYFTAAPLKIK